MATQQEIDAKQAEFDAKRNELAAKRDELTALYDALDVAREEIKTRPVLADRLATLQEKKDRLAEILDTYKTRKAAVAAAESRLDTAVQNRIRNEYATELTQLITKRSEARDLREEAKALRLELRALLDEGVS